MHRNFVYIVMGLVLLTGCGKKDAGMPAGFAVNVITETVTPKRIEEKISLVGTLAADESVEIKNEINGVIEEIGFEEGQAVSKGQMLFKIGADKLDASLAQAQADVGLAQTMFDRHATLLEAGAVSQQEYDQVKSDLDMKRAQLDLIRAELDEAVILASFDGVMGERKVSVGQFVNQGTPLTFLIKQDPIKAQFRVPERYLGEIKNDQNIEVTVAAYPDEKFEGEVYFIAPQVDEDTRTALVKARIPNPDGKLRHGMFGNLNLIVRVRDQALVVSELALMPRGEEIFIYIVDNQGMAQMKKVTVGVRLAGRVEITEGLSAGDKVIVEGYQKIGPGMPVNAKDMAQTQEPPQENT